MSNNQDNSNVAAMHAVLEQACDIIRCYEMSEADGEFSNQDTEVREWFKRVESVLAKPARNCDRFDDEQDAQLEFLNEVWLISVDKESMLEMDKFDNWTDEMRKRYARWLLAPCASRRRCRPTR